MTKTTWKLQQIGERMWILATLTASEAAGLGNYGKGFAVVAEETRSLAVRLNSIVEKVLFDDEDINDEKIKALALELNFLALNASIEAYRLDEKGKKAAVCADEIRNLSLDTLQIFDAGACRQTAAPWPKTPVTTAPRDCFISFSISGTPVIENLKNIQEVVTGYAAQSGSLTLRQKDYPIINGLTGKPLANPSYVILRTPWAGKDCSYAVAVDEINCLFYSAIGKAVDAPAEIPFAKYVRECWENENGEPFYFIDWTLLA